MKRLIAILLAVCTLSFAGYGDYSYDSGISNAGIIAIQTASEDILETQKNITFPEANYIARLVYDETYASPLEFSYVMAIIKTESRFNVNAKSYCGAMGLMQIMPKTFEAVAKKNGLPYTRHDAYDPKKNIQIGVLYLESLYERYAHLDYVSAGYNGGPGAANKYVKGKFYHMPKQTQNYVMKVRQYHNEYRTLIGDI